MALDFRKLFAPALLGTSASVIYTMPATPTTSVIKNLRVRLTNTDTVARAVTLYAVPDAGSPSATNNFLPNISLAAGSFLDVDVPTLDVSDTLQGLASAASVVNIQEIGGTLYS
jgi:hypothetical protein